MKITVDLDLYYKLGAPSLLVYSYLKEHPRTTFVDLVNHFNVDINTLRQTVHKLRDMGYIEEIYDDINYGGRPKFIGVRILK